MVKLVTFCRSTGEETCLTKVKLKALETSISTEVNNKHYSINITTDYLKMYNYFNDFFFTRISNGVLLWLRQ